MLGAQLFARKTRSVALTHVGKRFLEEARATLKQAGQAELVGRRAARGDLGSIAMGCVVLSARLGGIVPRAIMSFRKTHPDVVFQTRALATVQQMKGLADGTLDVGISLAPVHYPPGLAGFVIDRQPFWVAIPVGHPLAAREEIEPAMIVGEPLVATALETELGFLSNIRAITPPGASMRIVARVPDILSVLISVAAGIGLGVITESLAQLPVPGAKKCRRMTKVRARVQSQSGGVSQERGRAPGHQGVHHLAARAGARGRTPRLLALDPDDPHGLVPQRDIGCDHGGEFRRTVAERFYAEAHQTLGEDAILDSVLDLRGEQADRLAGRAG